MHQYNFLVKRFLKDGVNIFTFFHRKNEKGKLSVKMFFKTKKKCKLGFKPNSSQSVKGISFVIGLS
jgi:hypothetical protein